MRSLLLRASTTEFAVAMHNCQDMTVLQAPQSAKVYAPRVEIFRRAYYLHMLMQIPAMHALLIGITDLQLKALSCANAVELS